MTVTPCRRRSKTPAAPAHSITRKRHHASRYSHRLRQLARQNRHGRRARPDRDQLRGLGHRRHFPGFGRSSLARIGGTEISIEQFRQLYSERLQQLGRQLGRPITLGSGAPDGRSTSNSWGSSSAKRRIDERVKALRLGITDAEMARRITTNPDLLGPTGQFDRQRFEMMLRNNQTTERRFIDEQRRLLSAAAIGRHRPHRNAAAESRDGSRRALSERAAHGRIRPARARAGRRNSRPDARTAREIFRRAQGAVPRARISQDRHPAAVAGRTGDVDDDLRCRRAEGLRGAPRALSHARAPDPAADRLQRSAGGAGRGRPDRQGRIVPRHRQGTQAHRKGNRPRHADEGRDGRPGGRRRRLRAQGGRGERAGQGPVWHRAGARAQDRTRGGPAVQRSARRAPHAISRTSAPAPRSFRSTTSSRTSVPSAGRWRRPRPI